MNQVATGSGYLPARYAPFAVTPAAAGLAALTHPDGAARLSARWNLIQQSDDVRKSASFGRNAADMSTFYDQAKILIDSPDVNKLFSYATDEYARYGSTSFGASLLIARNLVNARRGPPFVQVTLRACHHPPNIPPTTRTSLYPPMTTFTPPF